MLKHFVVKHLIFDFSNDIKLLVTLKQFDMRRKFVLKASRVYPVTYELQMCGKTIWHCLGNHQIPMEALQSRATQLNSVIAMILHSGTTIL